MKTGLFTPKPGDLFQWYFNDTEKQCVAEQWYYDRYISSVEMNLLVALTDTCIWWIQNNSLLVRILDNPVLTSRDSLLRKLHPRIYVVK